MSKRTFRGGPDDPELPPIPTFPPPPLPPETPDCPSGTRRAFVRGVGFRCEPVVGQPPPCPPGMTRGGPGGTCASPFKLVELPEPLPPKEARGPLPGRIITPPKGPPGSAPSGPSPADVLPRAPSYPQTLPVGRSVPVSASVLARVRQLSIAGTLSFVWALVFGPYLTGPLIARPSGPPRRTRRPTTDEDVPPFFRYEGPFPRYIPTGAPPVPLPSQPQPGARSIPRAQPQPRALPTRPRTLPGAGATVQPVLAPAGWTLGDPETGPGYDPFTVAPPTPSPRAPARPFPRDRDLPFPLPSGLSFPIGDPLRSAPGTIPRRLTPQRPPRPATPPRVRLPPAPRLTPISSPVPRSEPLGLRAPTEANPCTTERTARRRRQRECKKFTTKTIRVCADK